MLLDVDGQPVETWREDYPYDQRMTRRDYYRTKRLLQIELLKLPAWIKYTDRRLVLVFEGRDAAGKGGAIRSYTEHLNPRGARVVVLEKPTEVQRTQWYFQRYIEQLPAAGEVVFFDRSLDSLNKWDVYTAAKERMFRCTHPVSAPWTVVKSNDKKRGRLELMRYVLSRFNYTGKNGDSVGTPDPLIVGSPDTVRE